MSVFSKQVGGKAHRGLALSVRLDVTGRQPPSRWKRRPQGARHRPRRWTPTSGRRRTRVHGDVSSTAICRRRHRRRRQRRRRGRGHGGRHSSDTRNTARARRTVHDYARRRRSLVLQGSLQFIVIRSGSLTHICSVKTIGVPRILQWKGFTW